MLFVYIYEYDQSNNYSVSSKMIIKNRFNLIQESYNGDIKISAVQPMFIILIITNAISLIVGIIFLVKDIKQSGDDKKQKIEESKELAE